MFDEHMGIAITEKDSDNNFKMIHAEGSLGKNAVTISDCGPKFFYGGDSKNRKKDQKYLTILKVFRRIKEWKNLFLMIYIYIWFINCLFSLKFFERNYL